MRRESTQSRLNVGRSGGCMQACTDRSQSQTFSAAHLLTCGKTGTPGCKPNNELNHECIRPLSYLLTCGKMRTCGCSHSCELVGSGSGQNTSSTADASCSGSEGAHELSRQACQECKTVQGHTECQKLSLHAQNRAPPADLHPAGARRTRELGKIQHTNNSHGLNRAPPTGLHRPSARRAPRSPRWHPVASS